MSNLDSLKHVLKEKTTNWSQAIKQYWKRIIVAVLIIAVILIAQMFSDKGFGEVNKPPSDYYRPAKTLWDLLSLLVVPLGLGLVGLIVGYLLNSHQREREEKSQTNRFQEETLQKYLDVMTQLMLKEGLRNDNTTLPPHVQKIARYRTLTVLRELDGERKATLLRFLYESHLIEKGKNVVSLDNADFSKANLCGVKLQDAHLEKVNLSEANLSKADLRGAYLYEADLNRTDLRGAKLAQADFGGAILSYADLTDVEEYTHDQLLKASLWRGIKPSDLENSLSRQRPVLPPPKDLKDWLRSTDWLKMTDLISHKTTSEYNDDENETHGRWVVTRGRHKIEPLEDFCLGIYLVTNELFLQFVQDKGYDEANGFWKGTPPQSKAKFLCQDGKTYGPSTWSSKAGYLKERARHPVAGISYYEALAFCRWLNRAHPLEDDRKWSLPTENMWELVARAGKDFLYPWGPEFKPDHCNSTEAKAGTTTEVDRFQKGKSIKDGCFDMAGNVWEFVREDNDEHWYCVLRGGSYRNDRDVVKSSFRLWGVPRDHRPPDFGFRCALVRDSA